MRIFMRKWAMIIWLFGNSILITHAATQDIYPFSSPQQAAIFKQVTHELRCLVCQNQNLADSAAPLAQDLRAQIYRLIQQGADKKQVVDYIVVRYGNFILFKPRLTPGTYLIWFGPFVLLGLGLAALLIFIRRRQVAAPVVLTAEEQVRLRRLLVGEE